MKRQRRVFSVEFKHEAAAVLSGNILSNNVLQIKTKGVPYILAINDEVLRHI